MVRMGSRVRTPPSAPPGKNFGDYFDMAKKGARMILKLQCGDCGRQNYITERNKLNTPDKLSLEKYCPKCRKHTLHKENAKMK